MIIVQYISTQPERQITGLHPKQNKLQQQKIQTGQMTTIASNFATTTPPPPPSPRTLRTAQTTYTEVLITKTRHLVIVHSFKLQSKSDKFKCLGTPPLLN